MKILIAGGCGFVGGNMAVYFAAKGHKVICVDNLFHKGATKNVTRLREAGAIVVTQKIQAYKPTKEDYPDVILNCSAQSGSVYGIETPLADFYGNVETTVACLELARQIGSSLIHWSTNKVYSCDQILNDGTPDSPSPDTYGIRSIYGATKLSAEILIEEYSQLYGIDCIRNRFSCLAGPHQWSRTDQGWITLWVISHILKRPLVYYGFDGNQVRDVLHIDDMINLIDRQLIYLIGKKETSETVNQIYNVGGGPENAISLRKCTEICEEITGNQLKITSDPIPRWADQEIYVSTLDYLKEDFNWQPNKSPETTIRDIYDWAISIKEELKEYYGHL